ncbi:MAG: hypothetical protein JNL61_13480, partial [Rhizobiaceae bacterium]|nr:hypothetical protein [Rhizobiaceae bacterium]
MRTIIAVAAVLAAGLATSVASAEGRPSISLRAQDTSYTPAKAPEAAAKPRSGPASQRGQAETTVLAAKDKARSQIKTASVAPAKPVEKAKLPRKKGRERIVIDPTTTASIAPVAKPAAVSASGPYGEIINRYAVAYVVTVTLAHAVIRFERNYRPYITG